MAAMAIGQPLRAEPLNQGLAHAFRLRWVRMLATAVAIAAAGFLFEAPPVVLSILPAPVGLIGGVIFTQVVNLSCQGLMIALSLEVFWFVQSLKPSMPVQIVLGGILLLLPALLSPLSLLLPISYEAVYQTGLTASREDLGFHLVRQGLVLSVIASVYSVRRRHVFEQQMRREGVAREWQDANRAILESRLQAIQARVEPQLLFDALGSMREIYGADLAQGEALLDALIDFLRKSLPRTRFGTSSVGFEIELLKSYIALQRIAHLARPTLTVDAPERIGDRTMAAGVLQPLMAAWLQGCGTSVDAAFSVHVHCTTTDTVITVTGPNVDLAAFLAKTELNLRGSHDAARVSSRLVGRNLECKLEYPNDIDQIQSA